MDKKYHFSAVIGWMELNKERWSNYFHRDCKVAPNVDGNKLFELRESR